MQTANMVDENIKRIGELFPNCLTERLDENGRPEVAIDFDQLRQELSKDIVEGPEERYQFTWPDKRNAIRLANAPTTDTLRPCREESVDFDNTQNLYIEGDNLQVLKLLRENYLGKVKMIYIDPPYNTGNDFVYNDNFDQDKQEYVHNSGQYDEEGNQLVANTESNGRFHTDWLNMIYPRLKVAKDLLSEDGVIFISIDDHEVDNLKKICNEIFGHSNFISTCIRRKNKLVMKGDKTFKSVIEPLLVFAKKKNAVEFAYHQKEEIESDFSVISAGYGEKTVVFKPGELHFKNESGIVSAAKYKNLILNNDIKIANGVNSNEVTILGEFKWSEDKIREKINTNAYILVKDNKNMVLRIYFKSDTAKPLDYIDEKYGIVTNEGGMQDLAKLDMSECFSYPKPVDFITFTCNIINSQNAIVLDFFSGSATTAHAIMKQNAEDGGCRKFIMVQLPENLDESLKKADNTNRKTIENAIEFCKKNNLAHLLTELGKERIRRAGKKILEEQKIKIDASRETLDFSDDNNIGSKVSGLKPVDVGFRVLKLDSSNMQDVYYSPEEFNEKLLFEDNIKSDRTDEDLLFQAMIELGIELSAKIECLEFSRETLDFSDETTAGRGLTSNASKLKPKIKVWNVAEGYLMACFDKDVNETAIKAIAKQHPYYFVLRDASLATDQVADNFEQIWEEYSKDTIRRII